MWTLALACAFFILIHMLVSGSEMRQQMISAIGARTYFLLFSLLSLGGFFWMVTAFYGARIDPANAHLWAVPYPVKILAFIVNFVAIQLIVVGAFSPSPTGLGALRRLPDTPVSGIIRVSRHPMLAGIGLLSAMHLITGDSLAAWVFFGSLLALCLLGASSIDRKRELQYGETYRAIMKSTSILPFMAIIQKRTRFEAGELGIARIMLATSLFTCLTVLHELLFGPPAL